MNSINHQTPIHPQSSNRRSDKGAPSPARHIASDRWRPASTAERSPTMLMPAATIFIRLELDGHCAGTWSGIQMFGRWVWRSRRKTERALRSQFAKRLWLMADCERKLKPRDNFSLLCLVKLLFKIILLSCFQIQRTTKIKDQKRPPPQKRKKHSFLVKSLISKYESMVIFKHKYQNDSNYNAVTSS